MDVLAKRGTFGDFGHVRKGRILKGLDSGQAKKLLASGSYVEATPEAIKEFDASRRATKKRSGAEQVTMKLGVDAADLKKLFDDINSAIVAFREEVVSEIIQMKERLDAGANLTSELAGLKEAIAGVAVKIEANPIADKEGAGGASTKAN